MTTLTKTPRRTAGQLRSYIAPAAPATRAPCDGTESDLRIEFGFTPKWYRERCGIDFSETWHLNPVYRRETLVAMRGALNRHFPELRLGGDDPESAPGTLDGVHGALTMSRIFGVGANYYPDNWPAARHEYLSDAQSAQLAVPDLSANPVFSQIMEQAETLAREYGRIEGYINWQGVLNNAFRLRGDQIFMDMMINPELAHHLFDVISETMIEGMRILYARQKESGVVVRHATVSNCVVNMVSPDQYREFLFPYDRRIAEAFEHFGIHNCAWNVDPYIADYARIEKLGYVDMGLDSDLEQARRLCPQARRALMYTPTDLVSKGLTELRGDLERIYRELGPCDVVMADIEHDTPDQRVIDLARIAREIAGA
ncbi:MAG: hypothetical protein KF886_23610 [Candidatus Hydrogenedentes bacterium]|nr:hypothetical protein [Candidatus Hydrogenedentota bacterium]